MKKSLLFLMFMVIILLAAVILVSRGSGASSFESINNAEKIDIYKSLTCGCCDVYSSYVNGKTTAKVNTIDIQDSNKIKEQYGVPSGLQSCHTTIIEGYFVEGHVPLEAVEKLLEEQPDIAGIAMPGMPAGSPGMPGQKSGVFIVFAVNHDGTYNEFMRI